MRIITLVALGACLAPIASAQDRTIRVATFNLHNLFDQSDAPGRPDEGTAPKSAHGMALLHRAIDGMAADIVGVQEVENREVLEELNAGLARPFPFVELLEGNDGRGIDTGLLSRFPISSAVSHRHRTLVGGHRFARDCPVFRLEIARGRPLDVVVLHLKSKRGGTQSDAWRRAEATGVRDIVARRIARGVPSIVMGDMNDHRDAPTLAPLFDLLRDATTGIPDGDRFTYVFRGNGEQIDHVLVSRGIRIKGARIPHDPLDGSDHDPIVVELDLGVVPVRTAGPETVAPKPQSPVVTAAVDDLDTLRDHLLRVVRTEGKLVAVHRPRGTETAILNFHQDYKKAATAWISAAVLAKLGDVDALVGKTVAVTGPVYLRRGVMCIEVWEAEQINVQR